MASFSETEQTTINPHNQQPVPGTRKVYPSTQQLDEVVANAKKAQKAWKNVTVKERIVIGEKFMEELEKRTSILAKELSLQMGRPVSQTPGEIRETLERAKYMLSVAESSLADVSLKDTNKPGFCRFIKKEPLGIVLTPLIADRFCEAFAAAGLPDGLLTAIHLSPPLTRYLAAHPTVSYVSFTGSVAAGRDVARAATNADGVGFKGVALELGGKDPAYVREDADIEYSVGEIVDGAFFNSGQSCCAVERVYVHESVYNDFVQGVTDLVKKYKLGDPSDPSSTLGPVVSVQSATKISKQVEDAVKMGAKKCVDDSLFDIAKSGTAYVTPQVLINVDHKMEVMTEETFGPVVGIMKVASDAEALSLMNDSQYGLTASIWSKSDPSTSSELQYLMNNLECGTVFLNRCDYLDPALAWGGVKDSGRGVSLSTFGYDQLVRLKSIHLKQR